MRHDNERYKRILKFGSAIVILAIEIALYYFVWTYYYNPVIRNPFWRRGNWLVVVLYGVILAGLLYTYGGLKIGLLRRGNIIYSHILSIFLTNAIAYIQLALIDRRFNNPTALIILTGVDIVAILIWVFLFQWVYSLMFPPRQLLVVYGERPVFHILEKLNTREDKYIIAGAIHIDAGVDKIISEVVKYEGVIIGDIPSHERNMLLKQCFQLSIRTYLVPKLSDILMRTSTELNIFDTQLLLSRNAGPQIDQLFFKRIMDIVFASIMLIVGSPLFIIFAIAIKATDGGPVFYKQKRLTINGRKFEILKFRTMICDAEKDGIARLSSGGSDKRITGVGRILRATRMDELPQVFNILKGDMSLVGPRPERPEIAAEYEKEIPEFDFRLKMKAGLTGYAQVYGKYNTTPYDKLKLDMTYIRNYSLFLDLKLILMTPKILFMKESTEGVDDGKSNASLAGNAAELEHERELSQLKQEIRKKKLKEEVYGKSIKLEEELEKKKNKKHKHK